MMKRLERICRTALVACAGGFIAVAFLLVFAFATGLLSTEKLDTIGKALSGRLVEPTPERKDKKALDEQYRMDAIREAQRGLVELNRQLQRVRMELNERRDQIAALEGEAARVTRSVTERTEVLAAAEKAFKEKTERLAADLRSDGFKKTLKTLVNMEEAKAAEMLYDTYTEDQAVQLLRAFRDDKRAALITEIDRIDRGKAAEGAERKAGKLLKLLWGPDAKNTVADRRAE